MCDGEQLRADADVTVLARLAAAEDIDAWLVGGCVRDALLGVAGNDVDVACAHGVRDLAYAFAAAVDGSCFSLDKQRGYFRVVGRARRQVQFDFAPLQGRDIEADLLRRDFTINAMALPLVPGMAAPLFDPLGGVDDLRQRRLRMCSGASFVEDPARILKGIRHVAQFDLRPQNETVAAFARCAPLLNNVSGERLREELRKLFSCDDIAVALRHLFDNGVAAAMGLTAAAETVVAACAAVDEHLRQMVAAAPTLADEVQRRCGDSFSVAAALRLAAMLRCCTDTEGAVVAFIRRLHCKRTLAQLLEFYAKAPAHLGRQLARLACGERGRLLWLQHLGMPLPEGLFALLLTADAALPGTVVELYDGWKRCAVDGRIMPLLCAAYVEQYCSGCRGASLGEFYRHLFQAEIDGTVSDDAQARAFLRHWCESR